MLKKRQPQQTATVVILQDDKEDAKRLVNASRIFFRQRGIEANIHVAGGLKRALELYQSLPATPSLLLVDELLSKDLDDAENPERLTMGRDIARKFAEAGMPWERVIYTSMCGWGQGQDSYQLPGAIDVYVDSVVKALDPGFDRSKLRDWAYVPQAAERLLKRLDRLFPPPDEN